jgi:nucleoside-diphosphate-sugar epimerase
MKIIVTGAGGFVGSKLLPLLAGHQVVALDKSIGSIADSSHVTPVIGDIRDPDVMNSAFSGGCEAVVHLATLPGGAAEQDPGLARQVNVDATMALADAAVRCGERPRFVFASSIAVFADPLPAGIDDSTPLTPKLLYGAHKAMMEQWLATLSRRGALQAISLRLSGVVARPLGPSGLKSGFMSWVFHAVKAGERFVMPVTAGATSWLTSVDCAVANLAHALQADLAEAPLSHAITLPALRVRMDRLVEEIAQQSGTRPGSVSYSPDPELEAAFGSLPPLTTPWAERLGFSSDGNLSTLVARALASMAEMSHSSDTGEVDP